MREFDALKGYPEPLEPRRVNERTFQSRLIACERGPEFFDGARPNGYGGLKNDGRWAPIAAFMAKEYGLAPRARILQIQAEKGFLLGEFAKLNFAVFGTDTSRYARECADVPLDDAEPHCTPYPGRYFDLVIAIGPVYTQTLTGAVRVLREIERVKKEDGHSFITLGAYEQPGDFWLMRSWSLLGETILKKADWMDVMRHAGYRGDYKFNTATTLNLKWSWG